MSVGLDAAAEDRTASRPVEVTVRYWAGARRAAGRTEEKLTASTLGALIAALSARPDLRSVVASASFLIDGKAAGAEARLVTGNTVEVLPPFAGG